MSGLLLFLLGVLGTGLPSHSHRTNDTDFVEFVSPDHHGHAVILTDQSEQIPTLAGMLPLPTVTTGLAYSPILAAIEIPPIHRYPPHERAPPSTSPRAPPLPI